jgi:hypothetical protein
VRHLTIIVALTFSCSSAASGQNRVTASPNYKVVADAASKACASKPYETAPTRVGDVICLKSAHLDDATRKGFFDLSPKAGDVIEVDDLGGNLDMAMDIGDFIYEHDNLVVVDGVCFSACANHLALGAKRLAIIHNGTLSFHIGPPTDQMILKRIPFANQAEWIRVSRREFNFFKRRGINPSITFRPPEHDWNRTEEYWWTHGWNYSVQEMRSFGVKTVVYCDGISCLPRLNPRVKFHAFKRPVPMVFGPPSDWRPQSIS